MKSKSVLLKQQRNIYELKKTHQDKYSHLLGIGHSPQTAENRLKSDVSRESLSRLKNRLWIAENSFGVTGVSLDGIKDTAEVKAFIKELEGSGVVTRHADSLQLTHPKMYRRGT